MHDDWMETDPPPTRVLSLMSVGVEEADCGTSSERLSVGRAEDEPTRTFSEPVDKDDPTDGPKSSGSGAAYDVGLHEAKGFRTGFRFVGGESNV